MSFILLLAFWFSPSCISTSLNFCQIRPFALSTYNPLHHSICLHSSLVSFSAYNSCGLLIQRPVTGQIRILFVFSVESSCPTRSSTNSVRSCCLHRPQWSLCYCDYHSHRCDLRKYRCLINTDLTAFLTQSPNRTQSKFHSLHQPFKITELFQINTSERSRGSLSESPRSRGRRT